MKMFALDYFHIIQAQFQKAKNAMVLKSVASVHAMVAQFEISRKIL